MGIAKAEFGLHEEFLLREGRQSEEAELVQFILNQFEQQSVDGQCTNGVNYELRNQQNTINERDGTANN